MMTVYVVSYNISSRGPDSIAGVFTDPEVARKVRIAVGFGAVVTPIELNHIQPGFIHNLEALGMKL